MVPAIKYGTVLRKMKPKGAVRRRKAEPLNRAISNSRVYG